MKENTKKREEQYPDAILLRKEIEDGFKAHGITVDLRELVEYYCKIAPEYAAELKKLIDLSL